MRKVTISALAAVMLIVLAACNASTAQKLSQASDVFSKSLLLFQQGEQLAVQRGRISAAEDVKIQGGLVKLGTAGLALNAAIRKNETAPNVQTELNNVIDAINSLVQDGVLGIKDPQAKQDLSLALTTAESAIAVIASVVGSKSPAAVAAGQTTKMSSDLRCSEPVFTPDTVTFSCTCDSDVCTLSGSSGTMFVQPLPELNEVSI